MSKYGAIKTNGYHSKREAKRAAELTILERIGEIKNLREQVVFELAPSVQMLSATTKKYRKYPPIRYIADFVYEEGGKEIVEDCKGCRTAEYRIKRHLMMSVHGIDIKET